MSLIGDFFKGKKKTNQMPDIVVKTPQQVNPQAYGDLSGLAHRYINGEGTGFGEDFVSKTTNPVANSMRRNFEQFTAPKTASAFSARGIGRSNLAANEIGRQQGDVESNIGNMMAQMYQLNEAQKKTDVNNGASLSQDILGRDVAAQQAQSDQSERINRATAAEQSARYDSNNAKAGQFIQAGAQLVAPMISTFMPGFSTAAGSISGQPTTTKQPGATTDILGSMNSSQFKNMTVEQLLALIGA